MWYDNSVFVGTVALTVIACLTLLRVPDQAKDIVIPIVTGIAGFVTGYVAHTIKDAITTKSTVTKEEVSNAEPKTE